MAISLRNTIDILQAHTLIGPIGIANCEPTIQDIILQLHSYFFFTASFCYLLFVIK